MAKLNRSALIHWMNATPSSVTPSWYKIGKDVEDLSVDLSAEVNTKKNILDETSVEHKGYQPKISVNTLYADPSDACYELIKAIAMDRLKGEDCKTQVLEVIIDDTDDTTHDGWLEDAYIEVQSYGGPQGGIEIPYTLHFAGNRAKKSVTITNGVPSFT